MERTLLKQIFGGTPNKVLTTDGAGNVVATLDFPDIKTIAVADIDDPSPELVAETGSTSSYVMVYTLMIGGLQEYTIYGFQGGALGEPVDTPYTCAAANGYWIAVTGKYSTSNNHSRAEVSAGDGNITMKINGVLNVPVFPADPGGEVDGDVWVVDDGTNVILKSKTAGTIKGVELS